MSFAQFQTATATMKLITVDGYGKPTVSTSFTVEIDPALGYKRVFSNDGEEITGLSTIISANDNIDVSERNYVLEYLGTDYQVEQLVPFPGGNTIEHFEVVLR